MEQDQTMISKSSQIFVLIKNPSPTNNLGPFLRCCAAFAVKKVIFIGYEKCAVEGSHGASKYVEIKAFPTIGQARIYLKDVGVTSVIGILGDVGFKRTNQSTLKHSTAVIVGKDTTASSRMRPILEHDHNSKDSFPISYAVHTSPFSKDDSAVCFVLDKKSVGLPSDLAQICTSFVHLSSFAPIVEENQDAIYGLMDSQTCLSIVLHYYCQYVGYNEREFSGQKFQVEPRKLLDGEELESIRIKRRLEKERLQKEADEGFQDGAHLNLFM